MDRRWQLVLGCLDAEEPPFSKSTLVAFRKRLIEHEMDRGLVERTVEVAARTPRAFGHKALRAALDSSPLWGAGRVEDTYNLLGHALKKGLGVICRQQGRGLAEVAAEAGAPLLDEDYLILSTIHSAKGQEWDAVFILNVTDGCIPSDMATGSPEQIEEERRVLGVAMTRAKFNLHLIQPLRFFRSQQNRYGDRYVFAPRSRFIPDAILDFFECRIWPQSTVDNLKAVESSVRADVAARMREMWR